MRQAEIQTLDAVYAFHLNWCIQEEIQTLDAKYALTGRKVPVLVEHLRLVDLVSPLLFEWFFALHLLACSVHGWPVRWLCMGTRVPCKVSYAVHVYIAGLARCPRRIGRDAKR